MNIHKNAKLTPLGRERRVNLPAAGRDDVGGLVSLPNHGHTPTRATAVAGVCPGTAKKWLTRSPAGM